MYARSLGLYAYLGNVAAVIVQWYMLNMCTLLLAMYFMPVSSYVAYMCIHVQWTHVKYMAYMYNFVGIFGNWIASQWIDNKFIGS